MALNLYILSEIYESETWDVQVDGSLYYALFFLISLDEATSQL